KDKILQQVVGLPEKAQLDAMMGQP
ncbi:disulfide isomerase, partial [Salmonella enterica]|nr:disulfide isomerase [Salmonella enterica]